MNASLLLISESLAAGDRIEGSLYWDVIVESYMIGPFGPIFTRLDYLVKVGANRSD